MDRDTGPAGRTPPRVPRRGVLSWEGADTDGHRVLTWLAVVGVAAGTALAVFGLPGADLHGPLHYLGIMDPLCGATRGVRLTFLGDLPAAWDYNPAAIPLSVATLVMMLRGLTGWLTGRWVNVTITWTRQVWTVATALLVILWVNQQVHAPLLLTRL